MKGFGSAKIILKLQHFAVNKHYLKMYLSKLQNLPVSYFIALNIPKGLLFSRGENWQRARRVLSPTFSASKMKMVSISCASNCYIYV